MYPREMMEMKAMWRGYYAWFRLKTGFSQELYMSKKAG